MRPRRPHSSQSYPTRVRRPASALGALLTCLLALASGAQAQDAPAAEQEPTPFDLATALSEGKPMSADMAAQKARQNAPALDRAEAMVEAAGAEVESAREQLWPQLTLSARVAHIGGFPDGQISAGADPAALAAARTAAQNVSDPVARNLWLNSLDQQTGAGAVIRIPRNQVGLSARLTFPVSDVLLGLLPAIEAAESAVVAGQVQREAAEARVGFTARESYYQYARARAGLEVARRAVEQARVQKARIDAAVGAGLAPPADASTAASRVAAAEQAVAAAEAAVDVADASLRTLVQDEDGGLYAISEPILSAQVETAVPTTAELLSQAQSQRSEIRALRQTIDARRKQQRAQGAKAYPHLALYAGADYSMPGRYMIPPTSEFQPSWEVGATVQYTVNDSVLTNTRTARTEAEITALEADLAQLLRTLQIEVRGARAGLLRSSRNIDAAIAAELAAQDAYDQRMAALRAGEVTTADLFAAETELNRARLSRFDAAIDQRLARARLDYAIGAKR